MKKNYFFILLFFFTGFTFFSQTLTKLSVQHATKLAVLRNYTPEETKAFVQRATVTGVNLKPEVSVYGLRQQMPSVSSSNNLNFELQNFTGWAAQYSTSNCTSPTPNNPTNSGANFTTINNTLDQTGICTTGNDPSVITGVLPVNNPFMGQTSCRLGDVIDGCGSAYLSQSFTINMPDTQITLYYALVLYDGHPVADAPKFKYRVSIGGLTIDSVYYDATQAANPGSGFVHADSINQTGLYYHPWTAHITSLSNHVGQNVTIDLYTSDCNGGAHRGYAYIDFDYNGSSNPCGWLNPVSQCFVTTNNNLDNEIYFSHINVSSPQQGAVIYRKNGLGNWDSLGTVPAGQPDKFIDTSAIAGVNSYTYCVAPIDSCKNNYTKSAPHTSMLLQSSVTGNGQINLSWNAYAGVNPGKYHIYRGTSPSSFSYIGQVSSTTYTFTDVNPPVGNDYYKVGFVTPGGCSSNAPHDTIVVSNYVNQPITCNNAVSPQASICFVTTNDSLHNEIFFEHSNSGLEGTIVYRQNSMSLWDSIGFVPSSQTDHFIDLVANPNQQSWVYCVESVDSCGNYHGKSAPHTTILLQSSLGTNSTVNLSWNAYIGTPVSSYYIYRGSSQSTLSYLNQVSASTYAYTDLNPLAGNNFYRINFVAPTGCTSNESHGPLAGSNYKTNNVVGINQTTAPSYFRVYPNPANNILNIESSAVNAELYITDILGSTVKQINNVAGKIVVDMSDLQNGVYFIILKDAQRKITLTKKFVVQH